MKYKNFALFLSDYYNSTLFLWNIYAEYYLLYKVAKNFLTFLSAYNVVYVQYYTIYIKTTTGTFCMYIWDLSIFLVSLSLSLSLSLSSYILLYIIKHITLLQSSSKRVKTSERKRVFI
jgi:hypothetical protein